MAETSNIRGLGQKAQEAASQATQKAQDLATGAMQKTHEFASAAGEKAQQGLATVGNRMSSLAGTIRESAPHEGMIGSAAGAVAQGLETSGRYLEHHKVGDMVNDLGSLIKSYPFVSLGIAFGLGCLLGAASRRA